MLQVWILVLALLLRLSNGVTRGCAFLLPTTVHRSGGGTAVEPRDSTTRAATTAATPAAAAARTAESVSRGGTSVPSPPPSSVYVNLPFCRRRCFYCDFPIKVVGDRPGAAADAARPYVDDVIREIRTTAAFAAGAVGNIPGNIGGSSGPSRRGDGEDIIEDSAGSGDGMVGTAEVRGQGDDGGGAGGVKTLFFGGGTPSLCPPELVGLLIQTVRECYGIAAGAEISIEMDPGTFDQTRLRDFLDLGITRVSMGVQSFDTGLLEACGRAHSLADVYEAVRLLRQAKMDNFSIDLMSGLPEQTVEQWEFTLDEAISTGAAHISVYDLQVEAGTLFGRRFTAGEAPLPEDDTCADMYRTASRVLGRAGYDHYEISNYARPGFQSRHNRAYWENVPFLAFGNGAASYVDGHRFSRPRGLPEYGQWVNKLAEEGWAEATGAAAAVAAVAGGGEAFAGDGGTGGENEKGEGEGERPSAEALELDALLDDVMLGFRLKEGLDLEVVASSYGCTAVRRIEEGVAEGLRRGWVVRDRYVVGVGAGAGVGTVVVDVGGDPAAAGGRDSGGGSQSVGTVKSVHGSTAGGQESDRDTLERVRVEVDVAGSVASEKGGVESGGSAGGGLGRLRLSDPDGFLFSNSVISSVFCELDGWKRSGQEKDGGASSPAAS